MRIAIVGAANQGKTTFIDDAIKEWPTYRRSNESYRKAVKEMALNVNKQGNKHSQSIILDCLVDDIKQTHKGDRVLFDRCPLDNLVYSLWLHEKGKSDIDADFIKESIEKVKESLRAIDIIFFIPITKVSPVITEERNLREIDKEYIAEIDNIFKAIEYQQQRGVCPFFIKDDAPPIIEIFGSPLERIEMAKLYLNNEGDLIETASSVLTPENLDMMESLMRDQKYAIEDETKLNNEKSKIIGAKLGDKLTPKDLYKPSKSSKKQSR